MKKLFISALMIILTFTISATWIEIPENTREKLFDHISGERDAVEIEFSLNGYELETVSVKGETFQNISYFNEGEFLEIGKPDLPRFSRLVAIPDEGSVSIEILSFEDEVLSNMNIYPRQELQRENQPPNTKFFIDEKFYAGEDIFPEQIVETGTPAIMRDFRVVNVTINPFQFDPRTRELRIFKKIKFKVNSSHLGGENIKISNRKISRSFNSIYASTILNYSSLVTRDEEYQQPSYLFIYPNNTQVETSLDSLVNWKHQKGFEVHAANTSETGGSTSSIKNYIQNAYDNWENPPEFVCLVGDAGGSFNIPTSGGDQYYTLLEGADILADIFIGRLSFNSITEFLTILVKILGYERNPYLDETDWYHSALLVGDPGYSTGQAAITVNKDIKNLIDNNEEGYIFDEVYNGSFVSQMSSGLNSGVSYFNYRGYMGMSGWDNNNTANLTNGYKLPVAVIITCDTGSFEGTSNCRSEYFLKAGTPTVPKGAIAAIGTATTGTHTCFNNSVDIGIFYGIFQDKIYHMGGALNRGKLNLYMNYPNEPGYVQSFSYWNNLMGDPGMEIWTNNPEHMMVSYPPNVALGTNYVEVTVNHNTSHIPLENAWVTALMGDDEIFATGFTDSDGKVYLPIYTESTGNVKLTVTKHNFVPHLGSFNIQQSNVFVNVNEVNIDDDLSGTSQGNGDGIINPGEDIELGLSLKNFGIIDADSITASISSEIDFITITDGNEVYGTIAPGAATYSEDDFDFTVDTATLGGSEIILDIQILDENRTEWNDRVYLPVAGANLETRDYAVIDADNGILDPGETAEFEVTIENVGSVPCDDVYGTLSCENEMLTIEDADGYFGNVLPGLEETNSGNKFEVTAHTNLLPGTQIIIELQLYNTDGYDNTVSFIIDVGEVLLTDPLGPDAYGYYCYDDGDTDYYNVPVYSWVEIDPSYGGPGDILSLNDNGNDGDLEIIDLPFFFSFYGIEYNELTVCSNGWIAPGITDQYSYMNWHIPGPFGPSPMIAPFWDDLKTSGGHICSYFDTNLHYFVIEWSHLQNEYDNSEETFQVILYDQNFYPTSTGDGEILFQYKVINNVDQGWYRTEHGQYATVGIEDHTSEIGLEYTYNNSYPTAAKILQNEMAILFTGPPISPEEPFLVLGDVEIFDENGNGIVDYAENIDFLVSLNNMGENPATEVSATISTNSQFVTINNDTSLYDDIQGGTSGTNLTYYNIFISADCPDEEIVSFEIQVNSNEDSWTLYFQIELNAPVINFSNLFIDDGNNNILDPGETADLYISFSNDGGSDAYSTAISFSTNDPYITLNSSTSEFGDIESGTIVTALINVTVDSEAEVGHIASVNWIIQGDFDFSVAGEIHLAISQVPVFVEEHFDSFPPTGWHTEGGSNWGVGNGNYAGGTPPEAQFSWSPSTVATQRLVSMPLNTMGSSTLDLEFKHSINDFSGSGYVVRVETTSDGSNWNTVETWQPQNLNATTENLTVSTPDVGSENFQISWTFDGDSWDINYWYVDDIYIESGSPQIMGYITGIVVLIGGSGNVEDAQVTADSFIAHPDENGDYNLPVTPGTYDVSANLEFYETVWMNDIQVFPDETITIDFELNYMHPPENLTSTVEENDVELNWEMSEQLLNPVGSSGRNNLISAVNDQDKKNGFQEKRKLDLARNRALTGYNVYRDTEIIAEISDIEITNYTDLDLENGEYEYYVTAVYDGGESEPSNVEIVIIDVNSIIEETIPEITQLLGNYPNPFDQSTIIKFGLKENTKVLLEIYNIKGQKVRTLLNNEKKAGYHNIIWDGKDENSHRVGSGIYFYQLTTENYKNIRKMILMQ